jgi:glutathione S-transferase
MTLAICAYLADAFPDTGLAPQSGDKGDCLGIICGGRWKRPW